jgi:L-iditol 2-dehydrogenase
MTHSAVTLPDTMQAPGIYGIPKDIRVAELAVPKVGPDDILLKVDYCGLCNSEVKLAVRGHPLLDHITPPLVLGHEFCGDVIAVGDQVQKYQTGERYVVMSLVPCGTCDQCRKGRLNLCRNYGQSLLTPGGFAPYVLVQGNQLDRRLYKVPEELDDQMAALAEPLSCAINGIERADLSPGDSIVILGAGFMGLLLTRLAYFSGAGQIISIDKYPERLEIARQFGATDTINFETVSEPQSQVLDFLEGQGPDVTIEATGNPIAYEQAVALVNAKGGRVVFFGGVPKNATITIDPNKIHYGELEITGSSSSLPIHVEKALSFLASGKIDTNLLITHYMSSLDLTEAVEMAVNRTAIKIMLETAS